MATYPYIILADSEAGIVKRWRVVKMSTPRTRTDSMKITAGGQVDIASGVIMRYFMYTLKIPASTADSNYGILSDLEYLFDLTNPNGTPSTLLTLVDHYGVTHYVKFKADVAPEPLTTQLEGVNAWHYVQVNLIRVQGATGSGS